MSQSPPDPNADLLHPIATEAATLYETGGKKFSPDALSKLQKSLAALANDKMLGPALGSLVQLAAHLDQGMGDRAAADQLLGVAFTQTKNLEAQNAALKLEQQDSVKAKQDAFKGFTGQGAGNKAPVFGAAPKGGLTAKDFQPPPKKIK